MCIRDSKRESGFASSEGHCGLHPEIQDKKPQFQHGLYQRCGILKSFREKEQSPGEDKGGEGEREPEYEEVSSAVELRDFVTWFESLPVD
eukprot:1029642-Rhodomonas_salina.1